MIAYCVDIYEGDDPDPVLTHTTYGGTTEEAKHLMAVHAKYDPFLRAALRGEAFEGIPLSIETMVGQVS